VVKMLPPPSCGIMFADLPLAGTGILGVRALIVAAFADGGGRRRGARMQLTW
jgi:hypothetical protein